uniref:Uncharacterized protein n=1 Tax=Romanomermis culicivorax TaxID=13658 RepID=A0A915KCW9_ROMCU
MDDRCNHRRDSQGGQPNFSVYLRDLRYIGLGKKKKTPEKDADLNTTFDVPKPAEVETKLEKVERKNWNSNKKRTCFIQIDNVEKDLFLFEIYAPCGFNCMSSVQKS